MKKAILLMLIVLILPIVYGIDSCKESVELISPCVMLTPVLTGCQNYTYDIINLSGDIATNGNLSVLTGDLYQFNFTEDLGDYIVKLCDGTTREVSVIRRLDDDNMISITIGLGIAILFFLVIGIVNLRISNLDIKNLSFWIMFVSLSMVLIEIIYLVGLLYVNEVGSSLIELLKINFYLIAILGFGCGITTFFIIIQRILDFRDDEDTSKLDKWDSAKW